MSPASYTPLVPDWRTRLLRIWFATASRVAPSLAERHAARLFITPRRRRPRVPTVTAAPSRDWTLDVGGHRLVGWSWGDGPTVLLVHGWDGLAADMGHVADSVVRAGYRAIAFDMPAHGRSPGRRTSLAEWRRILPPLARAVSDGGASGSDTTTGTGRVQGRVHAVIAHSFGGAAVTLALAAGLQADRVVLLAPVGGPAYFIDRMREYLGLPAARLAGMERHVAALIGGDLADLDAPAAAAALSLPALILHDPLDPEVPWTHATAIATAWRTSVLVPVVAHGHYRLLSAPEVLVHVTDFVTRRSTGPTAGGGAVA